MSDLLSRVRLCFLCLSSNDTLATIIKGQSIMSYYGRSGPRQLSADEVMAQVAGLPVKLASSNEQDVFKMSVKKLVELFPDTVCARIVLVADDLTAIDIYELSSDSRVVRVLHDLQSCETTSERATLVAMKGFSTGEYSASNEDYEDWRRLHHECGIESFATCPLLVAQQAYGVICLLGGRTSCYDQSHLDTLQVLAGALAPYAAMMQKQQQVQVTKSVLNMMLPARVVAMIAERIGWTGGSTDWGF